MLLSTRFLLIFTAFLIFNDSRPTVGPFILQAQNSCDVCKRDNLTCHIISGLFTRPQLPIGYNMITQIPRGACNLSISELKRSRNVLALRRSDGTFVMNGDWAVNWSGDYVSNGTIFTYTRENITNLESIHSSGPLHEPFDLMVIYQQPNPGIKYTYQLPIEKQATEGYFLKDDPVIAPPFVRHPSDFVETGDSNFVNENRINVIRNDKLPFSFGMLGRGLFGKREEDNIKQRNSRSRKRKFSWRITGYTDCSRPCGGGTQVSVVQCVRMNNQLPVPARRCSVYEKPHTQSLRCNVKPCLAQWVGGAWSECSVSCGEGIQRRGIICQQEITSTLILNVAEGACLTPPSPLLLTVRKCHMPLCYGVFNEIKLHSRGEWQVGDWSQCSKECGLGVRTRHVTCLSSNCSLHDRPSTQSVCDMGGCNEKSEEDYKWYYTDWSHQCSSSCGTGMQTRKVICANRGVESYCEANTRPESLRPCSSDKVCGGQWYTGAWGQCTTKCGWGKQSRKVVCISRLNGDLVLTSEKKCLFQEKPLTEQKCYLQPCEPEWYSSDWSECSKSCESGIQIRNVRCYDESHRLVNNCNEILRPPARQTCNTDQCIQLDLKTLEKIQNDAEKSGNSNRSKLDLHSNSTYNETTRSATAEPITLEASTSSTYESISNDVDKCVDIFTNCHLVVQARLCRYKYYNSSCCSACLNRV